MADIALLPAQIGAAADVRLAGGDVLTDGGLETAVYLSLFTDAQDPVSGDGGYWGDAVDDAPRGSLLWTLAREVVTAALPGRLVTICQDALRWLVDDGIAQSVGVTASIVRRGVVAFVVTIVQASGSTQYSYNWASQAANGF